MVAGGGGECKAGARARAAQQQQQQAAALLKAVTSAGGQQPASKVTGREWMVVEEVVFGHWATCRQVFSSVRLQPAFLTSATKDLAL
jgi:hypothetical protein